MAIFEQPPPKKENLLFPRPDPAILAKPPPFKPHSITELRAGKIRTPFNVPVRSAIRKAPIDESVEITKLGIPTDEHAFEQHGGPDKALLHYCSKHYAEWKKDLPEFAHLFVPGSFGENLFTDHVDERGICIGDILAIGDEVIVECSEPRPPCFKLGLRFGLESMPKRAQYLFRTGWMYRILKTGIIKPGDRIELLERPHPEWTIARLQYYQYYEMDNVEAMKELIALEQLGIYTKDIFRKRLTKGLEDQDGRLYGASMINAVKWQPYKIVTKRRETSRITSFILEGPTNVDDTPIEPGSHVRVKLDGRLERSYSVVSGTLRRVELGVSLDANSRGGSRFLHEHTDTGDTLDVGPITSNFPMNEQAGHHIVIAGGIGITAFLQGLQVLHESGKSFELHLALSDNEIPFERYTIPFGDRLHVYHKSKGQRLDIANVVGKATDTAHLYCCGPERMMDAVKASAQESGLPKENIHFEAFQVTTSGYPFTVKLARSDRTIEVPGHQTLLEALRATGLDIDSSCEAGGCGTCKVRVCSGRVDHRGEALIEKEKGSAMLSCVSRGVGKIVLDV